MSAIANRAAKDKKRRAKLRARLEAAGVDPQRIERIIEAKRQDDRAARVGLKSERTREEILAGTDDSLWPDDTGYRPVAVDPLLVGPGRVNGVTAKVVQRRNTVTRFEHDRLSPGRSEGQA